MANKPLISGFQRLQNFPLTDTEVFDTLEALQDYVDNSPTAYAGQQCVVKCNPSSVYVIIFVYPIAKAHFLLAPNKQDAAFFVPSTHNLIISAVIPLSKCLLTGLPTMLTPIKIESL